MSDADADLAFEHVGTLTLDGRVLICDVRYFPVEFAGMRRGQVGLDAEIEVEPGTWQVLVARDAAGEIRFLLLTHDDELELDAPLDQADAVALLRVDSGRVTAIDPALRDDPTMQTAVLEAPREQLPCTLRPLDAAADADPSGALLDLDAGGVFELYASHEQPRRSLFLAISDD